MELHSKPSNGFHRARLGRKRTLCNALFNVVNNLSRNGANRGEQIHVSFSHSPTFHHAAKQIITTSEQAGSERTANSISSSQSQSNLHLFWNTTMNHFNRSFLEIFFISFYKSHSSSAEQCPCQLHSKTPQMRL